MPRSHRPSIRGKQYVVSSVHYLATMGGVRILESGGNAADAGIAVGICINVLQPGFTHFGGVAPIIYCPGSGAPVETISGLGRFPRAASIDYFRKYHDGDLPPGILRTVTPASPDAWLTALARFGTMTFEEVIQPALDLVENGHPVDDQFHAFASRELGDDPSTIAVFNPGGHIPQVGEIFFQKDLGNTFRRMIDAERGASGNRETGIKAARDLIYKGEIAHEIADFHAQEGGLLTYEDLAAFSVRVEPPTHITYKGYDVYTCGPWCQGPTLNMALKILEGADLQGLGYESADYLHTVIEGLKLAFADREAYFGDPDFVQVPMAGLLDERYAAERRAAIDPQRATPEMPLPGDPWRFHTEPRRENGPFPTLDPNRSQPERISHWESDTSYLCVVDARWQHLFRDTLGCGRLGADCSGIGLSCLSTRHADMARSVAPLLSAAVEASTPHPEPCDGFERWKAVHAVRLSRRRCTGTGDAAGVPQYHRVRDGTARGDRCTPHHQSQFSELVLASRIAAR